MRAVLFAVAVLALVAASSAYVQPAQNSLAPTGEPALVEATADALKRNVNESERVPIPAVRLPYTEMLGDIPRTEYTDAQVDVIANYVLNEKKCDDTTSKCEFVKVCKNPDGTDCETSPAVDVGPRTDINSPTVRKVFIPIKNGGGDSVNPTDDLIAEAKLSLKRAEQIRKFLGGSKVSEKSSDSASSGSASGSGSGSASGSRSGSASGSASASGSSAGGASGSSAAAASSVSGVAARTTGIDNPDKASGASLSSSAASGSASSNGTALDKALAGAAEAEKKAAALQGSK